MQKLITNTPLDKLLNGGIESDVITNIYGPAGSGKSNITISAAIAAAALKKVIYVDTEGSFSLERFRQLGGTERIMKNIILFEPHMWNEQHIAIEKAEKLAEKEGVSLVIVDSLVALYRLELDKENFPVVNKQLATQYSILSRIARKHKIPVLVTNQVYGIRTGTEENIELTSRAIAKYWSKALIELKKADRPNHRIAIIRKHRSIAENKSVEFEITESKLKEVKFGIF